MQAEEAAKVSEILPLLPMRMDVVFPQTVTPLIVNRPQGLRLIEEAQVGGTIGLVAQINVEDDEPGEKDLHPVVCVGTLLKMLRFPDGTTRIVVQGLARGKLVEVVRHEPFLLGQVDLLEEDVEDGVEIDALVHHVVGLFDRMVEQSGQVPEELQVAVMNTRDPGRLADLLASSLPFPVEEKQKALAELSVKKRLELLGPLLARQLAVMELAGKIQAQVGSEITRAQREHFLREQIKAIQAELGEEAEDNPEVEELWRKIEDAKPTAEVLTEARREIERLTSM
ncbi:MAG TPA: LON peptidase substrate-binding domain-containing protein, partial [Isosphaeraceae bacterium]|nr:LON peptidase substrate-binding domain-containing protein [Isosphaeraceae bacterium]